MTKNYETLCKDIIENSRTEDIEPQYRDNGTKKYKCKKIFAIDKLTGAEYIFNDSYEAAEFFKISQQRVSQICRGNNSKKYYFEYLKS